MNVASPLAPGTGIARQTAIKPESKPKRFTIADYHRLMELGFLREGDRVELIRGELFEMAAQGTPHTYTTTHLCRHLDRLLGDEASVRGQVPITISTESTESEPEPDVVIARIDETDYFSHHPYPEDILLLIEVSDTTLEYDRTTKLSLYAEANIPHYWIANVKTNQMECHTQPYQDGEGNFSYQTRQIVLSSQSIETPGFPDRQLNLNKIFPPVPQA
jgi:Uma2 family endonuclease